MRIAFEKICLDKMLSDGYFDMSFYIYGHIFKEEMFARLTVQKSRFAALYRGTYPKEENAVSVWRAKVGEMNYPNVQQKKDLTYEDASAIVYWVYRVFKTIREREEFTQELFRHIKDLHMIQNDICFSKGVIYNASKVEVHFFSSVSEVNSFISFLVKNENAPMFYRGHANSNYVLRPSIMRTKGLQENESKLYNELLINCPEEFQMCRTHLEKLVKMQHYGLPTRLLDITRNMLVALFLRVRISMKLMENWC